jgi:DNA-binding transcriptional MocR family regulator
MGTIFALDADNHQGPKYKAVIEMLRDMIASGALKAGDKLPPVRGLAWDLGMTPGTIARAYQDATTAGLLEATVGRGTFVAGATKAPVTSYVFHGIEEDNLINLRNSNTTEVGQAREIADAMIEAANTSAQNYNFYPGYEGRHPVYPYLSKWMEAALLDVDPETIIQTHGGQSSISIALQSILQNEKGGVAIDALAYPGIRYAVQAQGGVLHGIKMDDEGMIPEELEKVCKRGGIRVIFVCANVLNPTLGMMSLERRIAIAEIARKYDTQLIEDDCWGIGPATITGFLSICPERAWYITSITKNISAGLRFGWLACPKDQMRAPRRAIRVNSFGVSRAVSDIAYALMKSGAADDIRGRVQIAVNDMVRETVNLLGQWDISYRKDIPFIWLRLPQGWRASAFGVACERAGISVRPADEFSIQGTAVPNAVRIALNNNLPEGVFIDSLKTISELLSNPPNVGEG